MAVGVVALVTVIAGIGLRCVGISARSLWFDEASSWWMATHFSGTEFLDRCAANVHPPLYYTLLWGWIQIWGDSPVALRSLSVLFGIVTIVLGAQLVTEIHAPGTRMTGPGLAAAALLATNAGQIVWSQEARMYSLGSAATVASSWLLLCGLNRPMREVWWCLAAGTAAALPYVHNYGLWTLLAQSLFIAGGWIAQWRIRFRSPTTEHGPTLEPGPPWSTAALYWGLAWLAYLPWLQGLLMQTRSVRGSYWIWLFDAWSLPCAYYELFDPHPRGREAAAAIVLGVAGLLLLSVASLRQRRRGERLLMLLCAVPPLMAALVSMVLAPIVVGRYLLFSQTALLCAFPLACWRWLPSRSAGWVVGTASAVQLATIVCYQFTHSADQYPGVRGAAEYLASVQQPGDAIVVEHTGLFPPLSYYLRGRAVPALVAVEDRLLAWNGRPFLDAGKDYFSPAEVAAWKHSELWVTAGTGYGGSFSRFEIGPSWEIIPGTERRFQDVDEFRGDVIVARYRRKDAQP